MTYAPFVHLRNHTAYSLAEGALKTSQIVSLCQEYKMPAVAITDTNNIFGGAEFSKYITEGGIQPILGTQISVDFEIPPEIILNIQYPQLILLVQNETGYKNLIKLLSFAYTKKQSTEYPHIKLDDLKELSEGLIALSGGTKGVIGQCLLFGNMDLAEKKCKELHSIFQDRFYIELMRHNLADEIKTEDEFLRLAYEYNIPIVATNECYFSTKDMHQAHDILLCIADAKFVDDDNRRHETVEHYFKTSAEMIDLFEDLPEAIENTILIAKRCAYKVKKSKELLPHVEKGVDEIELLRVKSKEGLIARLEQIKIITHEEKEVYLKRLEYELDVIIKMGFPGYFLIVEDFISWAKKNDIPVGPGRGSGAGSVVAWSLNITDLNPLQFGLLFERFLNPDRVSMPDFDIDFCQDRRGEVIHYIQKKYGEDSVGQIITFGKLQAKNAIKDVGRVLRIPYLKCDDLCKMIPNKLNDSSDKNIPINISNLIKYQNDFAQAIENDDVLKGLIKISLKLEGLFRNVGTHAAGVVIGDRPLNQLVALYKDDKSDIPATQYNMKYVEDTGLVKYDFLGLKTLTVIKKTCDIVKKTKGIDIDISTIPMDDIATYKLLSLSNTLGVFQFESRGMQEVILNMKPDKIEDLIALVSLYRPGPMDSIPTYIARKFGEKIEYLHPLMEPILCETYGIMVYQEQVMEIGRVLAGYTLGGADLLRRAMGKKIIEEMAKQRVIFKNGCLKHNNIDETTSMKIFDSMEKFANYGFNKSHAACYAWISYQTAYLKTNFTAEFIAASMTYDMGDMEKLGLFSENIKKMNIKLLRPNINKSFEYFAVENGDIRYALSAIKGVGSGVIKAICEERETNGEFQNITDFINRIASKNINKRMLENLIIVGAFDDLEPNRAKLFENCSYILLQIASANKDRETNQSSLFSTDDLSLKRDDIRLKETIDWKPLERMKREYEIIGFYISSHPLDIYGNILKSLQILPSNEIKDTKEDKKVSIAGIIDGIKSRISKAGNQFYIVHISDTKGNLDILFSEKSMNMGATKENLESGKPVIISADIKVNERGVSVFGGKTEVLSLNTQLSGTLKITIKNIDIIPALKKTLEGIGPGYICINLIIIDNNKKSFIILPEKYNITSENLELFKTINDIEYSF